MKAYLLPPLFLLLAGCATVPRIVQGSPNYLAVGAVRSNLVGNSYYMAIGDVNLYRPRAFGGIAPTGATGESAVAIQVDQTIGRVQRIVTLQPYLQQQETAGAVGTVIVTNTTRLRLANLIGGISLIDIHHYATWLAAVKAMRAADAALGTSGNFRPAPGSSVSVTVAAPPVYWWLPWPHRRPYYGHEGRR